MSRIVAGTRGGQRIVMPPHAHTRPTSDRVREAAFSLIADWAGTSGEPGETQLLRFSFLDLFGGSGAVALEAASRGAAPVTCVEKDRATASVARRNVEALGSDVAVVVASVDSWLAETQSSAFDVAWLDPPYALENDAVTGVVERVLARGWLARDGLVVVERSSRGEPFAWPASLATRWDRRYGETTLYFATQEDA